MEGQNIDIGARLQEDCRTFTQWLTTRSNEQFYAQSDGKWSTAEVIQHLFLSARPVVRLLAGPREVLAQWGRSTQPARTYDDIESSYGRVLTTGIKAPAAMTPRPEEVQVDRSELIERFESVYAALTEAANNWPTADLDSYSIPHPVLGLLSVREMLYFTSVHTRHHFAGLTS